jgi:integrase/recombinase XerD
MKTLHIQRQETEMNQPDLSKFRSYLKARNSAERTIIGYTTATKRFLEQTNNKAHEDLTLDDIQDFCVWAKRKYHSNSLGNLYGGVKAYLQFCGLGDLVEQSKKARLLKAPAKVIPKKDVLTKDEIQSMFNASRHNIRDHAILKVLYYSAQRKQSIVDIQLSDINWETEELHIRAKGNREYDIDLNPEALSSIKAYLKVRPNPKPGNEDWLFLSEWGRKLTGKCMWDIVKKYAVQGGIKKPVYPHLFRASAITHMDESGMSLAQIKLQSGHKKLESLNTYIRPDKRAVKPKVRTALDMNNKQPTQPQKRPEPQVDPNLKKKEVDESTDSYIASLEARINSLEAKLKDKYSYMYG